MATFSTEQIKEYGRRLMEINAEMGKLNLENSCSEVHKLFYNSPRDASTQELSKKWNGLYNITYYMSRAMHDSIYEIGFSIDQYANATIENEEEAAASLNTSSVALNAIAGEFQDFEFVVNESASSYNNANFENSEFNPGNEKYWN